MRPHASQPRPSILVVDDYADSRELIVEFLSRRLEATLLEASNGENALESVARRHPTVIVLDLVMPGMSGWEVARRLKNDPATRSILILAHTGFTGTEGEAADSARAAGCDAFVPKPVAPEALAQAVERLLAQAAQASTAPRS